MKPTQENTLGIILLLQLEILLILKMNKETENKIADHQIRQYSPYDHTKDVFTFQEPPKTGWDLYITPEFTLNNIKPVNWFNRKMQELILGFKWKRQKA